MKQLPDILSSANFWASIATMWAAAGAWGTYVALEAASRKKKYDGIMSLVEGLEAELALVSAWASGEDGAQGYPKATRLELVLGHPDWFNPSRMVFKFSTPRLNDVTNSAYVGSLGPIIPQLVTLNHAIHQLLDSIDRLQAFVMGDVLMYQSVMEKLAPKTSPVELALSPPPTVISMPQYLNQIAWTQQERAYINIIFMMNEGIHQGVIGGVDSTDACLYKSFRIARAALQNFKKGLTVDPLPSWFRLLHLVALGLAWLGLWEMMRWFGIW